MRVRIMQPEPKVYKFDQNNYTANRRGAGHVTFALTPREYKEQQTMSEKHKDRTPKKPNYMWVGVVIGAVLALFFAKTGSPGLIGVGAMIGMAIGAGLDRRSGR